ncbi:AAA family ATPase [Thermococcus nautili]|uniref:Putative ATPase (AAA+ superfamily) n=1 Tax=Thermococcus nautili TaxID=195522 RepID=W8P4Y7_9EURY|nr:ATP-binding protein [Thermococcus nautili]AHL22525.1 putative ATPase (AAA+ superfamily) [Thermococcus nautili]CAI1493429.1 Putative ATPase (AAA+ superfamily) [Thermococcus nautili]
MLFNPKPKMKREELYDREEELSLIENSIEKGLPLIVLLGIRRLGKSSLLNVTLNELPYRSIKIDARKVYSEFGSVPKEAIGKLILQGYLRGSTKERAKETLKSLKGVRIGGLGIELSVDKSVSLHEVLERIDSIGERFIIAIDEAQYLRFSNSRYPELIAWAMDELQNVSFILTGSEVGLLEDFLGIHNPESALFGRAHREIRLKRFERRQSIDFLRRGFEEIGLNVPEDDIEETVGELDGIVGWLTLYGYNRYLGMSHREALNRLKEDAKRLILSEFSALKRLSPRYELAMRAVANGKHRWKEIKETVELLEGKRIDDKNFSNVLNNLVRYGYLEKTIEGYFIPDPLVEHAFR